MEALYNNPFFLIGVDQFDSICNGKLITPDAEDIRHIRKSLRMRGDIEVFAGDGGGRIIHCRLSSKDQLSGVEKPVRLTREFQIELIMAPIKKKGLELMIQKTSELGVDTIRFINSTRQTVGLESLTRLQKIAWEACKQSRNPILPQIYSSKNSVANYTYEENCQYFWGSWQAEMTTRLPDRLENVEKYAFINGPEGGWSEEEEIFLKNRFPCINLSSNVLRSETAAITAVYQLKQDARKRGLNC